MSGLGTEGFRNEAAEGTDRVNAGLALPRTTRQALVYGLPEPLFMKRPYELITDDHGFLLGGLRLEGSERAASARWQTAASQRIPA